MLYQYWVVGQTKGLVSPTAVSKVGDWLKKQAPIQAVLQKTGHTIFLSAVVPGTRSMGVALWKSTGYPRGGYLLAGGTIIQIGYTFAWMLGLGKTITWLFR